LCPATEASPGFEYEYARLLLLLCFIYLLGLQSVQWIRELIVVRVNWPEHPGLPKKKKLKRKLQQIQINLVIFTLQYSHSGQYDLRYVFLGPF
jgi:hypothetical protein